MSKFKQGQKVRKTTYDGLGDVGTVIQTFESSVLVGFHPKPGKPSSFEDRYGYNQQLPDSELAEVIDWQKGDRVQVIGVAGKGRVKGYNEDRTHVHVEWDRGTDSYVLVENLVPVLGGFKRGDRVVFGSKNRTGTVIVEKVSDAFSGHWVRVKWDKAVDDDIIESNCKLEDLRPAENDEPAVVEGTPLTGAAALLEEVRQDLLRQRDRINEKILDVEGAIKLIERVK